VNNRKKIIVLGSNGQLGSEFKFDQNFNKTFDVISLDKSNCDILNFKETYKKISEFKPDYIINCAAYTKVDMAEINKDISNSINYIAVKNLAKISKILNSVLIHFSTDYVFDGSAKIPIKEDNLKKPINHYGFTKHLGEEAVVRSLSKFFIFRVSWVYGEYGTNFPKTMIELLKKRNEISVVNDQVGCPTPTTMIVNVIIKIIKMNDNSDQFGIFNLAPNGQCTWFDIADYISKNKYPSKPIQINPVDSNFFKLDAERPKYSVLDNQKIIKTFDLRFKGWDEYLKTFLNKV